MVSSEIYCSASEIRSAMDGTSSSDDSELLLLASVASRLIDGYMGYKDVGFVAESIASIRTYSGDSKRYLWVDPCTEITSVAMKDSVTETTYSVSFTVGTHVTGFRGDPKSKFVEFNKTPYHGILILPNAPRTYFVSGKYASEKGFPIHPDDIENAIYMPTVQVTAKWGYATTVPPIIKRATIMQSIYLYKRGMGAMASRVLSSDFNLQEFARMIDPAIKGLLMLSQLKNPNFGGR